MDQQRRFLLFIVLSLSVLLAWQVVVMPLFVGRPPAKQAEQQAAPKVVEAPADATAPANVEPPATVKAEEEAPKPAEAPEQLAAKPPEFPQEFVTLGSLDPESDSFLRVTLNTRGAAIEYIELNDPRYKELDDPKVPLKVVGHDPNQELRTLAVSFPEFVGVDLTKRNWEIAERKADSVTFRLPSPDGKLELRKQFTLRKSAPGQGHASDARDAATAGYELEFALTIRNLSDEPRQVSYELQGPVGLPLENVENTAKFRDIRMGYVVEGSDSIHAKSMTAQQLAKEAGKNQQIIWEDRIKFVGIDVQYFAALLFPREQEGQKPLIASVEPEVVRPDAEPKRSDISIVLESQPLTVPPGGEVTNDFLLYVGPKRPALLEPLGARGIADLGWLDPISTFMLWILNSLHSVGVNYGIAIVILTILVRGALFPISRRQAQNMQRMKEFQPKIQELKKKYENDKEGFTRAQLELYRKYNFNPLAGCLPMFLQLPVFFGLYRALSTAIDLRRAPFLWIDNLAAPDKLFPLPFVVPYFGWTYFNLLPMLTIVLFILQQKMFMPPPADEQAEMQQKMMNWMMIVMGVLFYQVPAGLCIYFITSSLWGMGERKMLDYLQQKNPTPQVAAEEPKKPSRIGNFWTRLQEAADAASTTRSTPTQSGDRGAKRSERPRR